MALVALSFQWAAGAPDAASVVSVVLHAGASPAYVLCPAGASESSACDASDAASTVSALRDLTLKLSASRIVLFVPGYATRFDAGYESAEHVQAVLGGRFLVVYVFWGSRGKHADYLQDERMASRQTRSFATLVSDLHAGIPDRELDVFAHSMGGRVVAGAMAIVKTQADGQAVIQQAVLAAPDISLTDYKRAITRDPKPFAHVTIYASTHDKALMLSGIINLHRRLGKMADWPALAATDVVDASAADKVAEGHGYAVHDKHVILDIGSVFLDSPIPHPAWKPEGEIDVLWGSHTHDHQTVWKLYPDLVTADGTP